MYTANYLRTYQSRYQFDSGRNSQLESECKGNGLIRHSIYRSDTVRIQLVSPRYQYDSQRLSS